MPDHCRPDRATATPPDAHRPPQPVSPQATRRAASSSRNQQVRRPAPTSTPPPGPAARPAADAPRDRGAASGHTTSSQAGELAPDHLLGERPARGFKASSRPLLASQRRTNPVTSKATVKVVPVLPRIHDSRPPRGVRRGVSPGLSKGHWNHPEGYWNGPPRPARPRAEQPSHHTAPALPHTPARPRRTLRRGSPAPSPRQNARPARCSSVRQPGPSPERNLLTACPGTELI